MWSTGPGVHYVAKTELAWRLKKNHLSSITQSKMVKLRNVPLCKTSQQQHQSDRATAVSRCAV